MTSLRERKKLHSDKTSFNYLALMLASDWIIFIRRASTCKEIIFEGLTRQVLHKHFFLSRNVSMSHAMLCVAWKHPIREKTESTRLHFSRLFLSKFSLLPLSSTALKGGKLSRGGKTTTRNIGRWCSSKRSTWMFVLHALHSTQLSTQLFVKWNDELKWMTVEYHFVTFHLIPRLLCIYAGFTEV